MQSGHTRIALMTVVCILALVSGWGSNAQSGPDDTFTITISLPAPTIHAGGIPVIEAITENKTNHIAYAGWAEGSPLVELINDKGEDISSHILGNKREDTGIYLRPPVDKLEPGYHNRGLWHIRTDPGLLAPGVYKLRIHRLDFKFENDHIKSSAVVYSNTVTLTVIP